AEVPEPDGDPHETGGAERHERTAPGDHHDEPGDDWRRQRVAEPRKGVREALREAAPRERRPVLHRTRGDRERGALAAADEHAAEKERRESAGDAGEDRRRRPDQSAEEQRAPRPESIPDPPTEDLEQ